MSKAEEKLHQQIKHAGLPDPVREYRFHPARRWRFDFAWPDLKLAVEVEGVTYFGKNKNGSMKLGRHQNGKGLTEDCIKYGEAMRLGWDVYRCTQQLVNDGSALSTIEILLKQKQKVTE